MDNPQKANIPNPYTNANLFSKLLFLWIVPIFKQGSKKSLTIDDLYNPLDDHKAEELGNQMERVWNKLSQKANAVNTLNSNLPFQFCTKPRLLKAIAIIHGKQYLFLASLMALDSFLIRTSQPIFVRKFTKSFSTVDATDNSSSSSSDFSPSHDKYIYGAGLCLLTIVHLFFLHIVFQYVFLIGMKCRIGVSSLIYKRVLRLSKNSEQKTTLGKLMNLLSTDVAFDFDLGIISYAVIGPIQLVISTYLLWLEFGNSAFAGIGCIAIIGPIQYSINVYAAKLRGEIAKRTDIRANMLSEIIGGIRIIKMYAWEIPFAQLIHKLRGNEIKIIKNKAILRGCSVALFNLSNKLVLFCIILIFVLYGHELTADKVFFAVTICHSMVTVMMLFVPIALTGLFETLVKCKRIENMLLDAEIRQDSGNKPASQTNGIILKDFNYDKPEANEIQVENVTASWTSEKTTLQDININLKPNQLVMVIGSVGSGKTSFLNLLLNELPIISQGKIRIDRHSLSYTPQESWLFPGTIRQNIIFDQPYDSVRYQTTVHACALEHDFEQFPSGDLTRIGDSHFALSGGQKTRINIARCMYRKNADTYLFDDPLSSVDSHVGSFIFENCFLKLLDGKLRILVTHQLQYLSRADYIIVLDHGKILAQGTYLELEATNQDFKNYLAFNKHNSEDDLKGEGSQLHSENEKAQIGVNKEDSDENENKEIILTGTIRNQIYWKYFKSGGPVCLVCIILFGFLINEILYTFGDVWLSYWTNMVALKSTYNSTNVADLANMQMELSNSILPVNMNLEEEHYVHVYATIIATMTLGFLLLALIFFQFTMKIGVNLHDQVFKRLIHAPIQFFDKTPNGRILNRFTKDLNGIDEFLPISFYEMLQIFCQNLCILLIVILTNYYMIFPTFFLFIVMLWLRNFYASPARDIKRIEATARSPLLVHLNATYNGLTTIRALNSQSRLIEEFHAHQDIHTSAWFAYLCAARWFAIWLALISVAYLIFSVIGFLFLSTSISTGIVGLSISLILSFGDSFQWAMAQSVEISRLMTSVERLFEYCSLEQEPQLESNSESKPPLDWPPHGEIHFDSVSLSYNNNSSIVLDNVSFHIKGGEKIGICGRTGAGKTSMISTLFRLTTSLSQGSIYIDGIDISTIGLHDLRKHISIIPQDPILFTGSVRYNLDPFEEFDDNELWQALEEVELKDEVSSLDFEINENANNFSVGQKQLICLARAILRNNKIIVLDEATANTDLRTDQLIQNTIRKKFSHCTMLTIAHRLYTIMDCDRIIVLENGRIKESGSPEVLLQNKNGYFAMMAKNVGLLNKVK